MDISAGSAALALSGQYLTDMDFKFELDTKAKKSGAKKNRRSGLPFSFSLSPREESPIDTVESPSNSATSPPKTRRSGGWAGESLKSAIRRTSSAFFEREQYDNRISNEVDDIPVIPNLDDFESDEIAKAPLVGQKVASYRELELDLLKHSSFSSLEDVNLRVLTFSIQSLLALEEPDVPWTRESLFSELFSSTLEEKRIAC